ncbi:orotidine-5'-phosphate decarboxylase [Actinomycetospora endophytica]|uniref:Orotidine-5'-phosphate decarboxylase n=1 Tax=Actinomycetospora endophytica TaxID=2291215 RepID=A0ABS8PI22_9PSEU|nr:orotidine-5'-phosphate decarboxylase [Actinomycetospora endophytica]MCD2197824.1 orotidine-5'-phosphate decarboxylase [Actinomycetospora endophytica]
MTRAPFAARLTAAVARHGPLCVGIDPHPGLLARWGHEDDAAGVERFGRDAVAALAGHVAVIKPQVALFEVHGSGGVRALERVLADAADAGLLTIADAKRGDIGSTMTAYASAWLADTSPLAADAVTLSPYLGVGSLTPAIDLAAATGRGVFVLARTSNPEAPAVQSAQAWTLDPSGGPGNGSYRGMREVAQSVVDSCAAVNAANPGVAGVVVGATSGTTGRAHGLDLSRLGGPVLVPGLGAQGATPADLAEAFAVGSGPVIPSSSREILAAGPDPEALHDACAALNGSLADLGLPAGPVGA